MALKQYISTKIVCSCSRVPKWSCYADAGRCFRQAKKPDFPRNQLVELKHGRLAMIAFSGMVHHYFITGKGPIQLISGN